jgi:hypothetical protein
MQWSNTLYERFQVVPSQQIHYVKWNADRRIDPSVVHANYMLVLYGCRYSGFSFEPSRDLQALRN